eukprot:scaffold3487_cov102-Isochrysis_galbana.AAC.3
MVLGLGCPPCLFFRPPAPWLGAPAHHDQRRRADGRGLSLPWTGVIGEEERPRGACGRGCERHVAPARACARARLSPMTHRHL